MLSDTLAWQKLPFNPRSLTLKLSFLLLLIYPLWVMVISALLRITAPCEGCLKSLHTALSLAMGAFSCNLKQMIWGRITGLYLRNSYSAFLRSHFLLLGCRMNRAPTTGYESDVGSKTTHQFVYPESYKELAENVSMILIPFKTLDLRWVVTALTTGTINL